MLPEQIKNKQLNDQSKFIDSVPTTYLGNFIHYVQKGMTNAGHIDSQ